MDKEPALDPLKQVKEQFEAARESLYENSVSAMDAYHEFRGAVAFFKLGLELGKLDQEQVKEVITELEEKLEAEAKYHKEQVFPPGYYYRNESYRSKQ